MPKKQVIKKVQFPSLPKGKKPKLLYRSNEYLNAVWFDQDKIEFYLWDEYSPLYNHVLVFPTLPQKTNKKVK